MPYFSTKRKKTAVQIIPMIDLLTILLIFFVVTTTWKKSESHIKVNLPKAKGLSKKLSEPDVRKPLTIKESGEIFFDNKKVDLKELANALATKLENEEKPKLELKADGKVELQLLVSIWDILKSAGYEINEVPTRISMQQVQE